MSTIFPEIWKAPPNSRCQEGDMKQVLYWGVTVLEWSVNLTLVWCSLLGACELIHLFVIRKPAVIILNMLTATIEKLDSQVTWPMRFLRCCAIWTWNTNFCLKFGITLYLELTCSLEIYNMVTRMCYSAGSSFRVDHLRNIKLSDGTISCVYNMVVECNPCLLYGHFTHDSVIFVNFILSDTLFELFSEIWI